MKFGFGLFNDGLTKGFGVYWEWEWEWVLELVGRGFGIAWCFGGWAYYVYIDMVMT